jgi:endonuclease YncB( thermonuclease family)
MRDFHEGHIKAVGVCPLCGEIITRTMQTEIRTGDELTYASYGRVGVTRRHEPTIQIKWMCAAGCTIEVRGQMPRGRNMNDEFFNGTQEVRIDAIEEPKPESLTGENLRELSPKAEQAKHALEELEEGMDSNGTKGESRSDAEPGRRSSSG